jgi:hypothetical protein
LSLKVVNFPKVPKKPQIWDRKILYKIRNHIKIFLFWVKFETLLRKPKNCKVFFIRVCGCKNTSSYSCTGPFISVRTVLEENLTNCVVF